MTVFRIALVVLAQCLLPHLLWAQEPPKGQSLDTCTMIGCELMSASVSIQRADGNPPNLIAEIEMDGTVVHCPIPPITDYPADVPRNCSEFVSVIVQPLTFCTNPAAAFPDNHLKCPHSRAWEELVHVHAVPRKVKITLWQGKRKVAERTFLPEYKLDYPNGERCGDPCKFWKTTWVLN